MKTLWGCDYKKKTKLFYLVRKVAHCCVVHNSLYCSECLWSHCTKCGRHFSIYGLQLKMNQWIKLPNLSEYFLRNLVFKQYKYRVSPSLIWFMHTQSWGRWLISPVSFLISSLLNQRQHQASYLGKEELTGLLLSAFQIKVKYCVGNQGHWVWSLELSTWVFRAFFYCPRCHNYYHVVWSWYYCARLASKPPDLNPIE